VCLTFEFFTLSGGSVKKDPFNGPRVYELKIKEKMGRRTRMRWVHGHNSQFLALVTAVLTRGLREKDKKEGDRYS